MIVAASFERHKMGSPSREQVLAKGTCPLSSIHQRAGSLLPAKVIGVAIMSDERLRDTGHRINSRPRKTLGWGTPY